MNLERGRISPFQLTVLIITFLMGSSGLISSGISAKNNAWLAIIVGFLIGLVFIWIFTSLANRYLGKTLIEINDTIYGPCLGKIFSIFYLFFFLHIGSMILENFGLFFHLIMPTTPIPIFIFSIVLICAFAVKSGIEVISRCSLIILLFLLIGIPTSLILLVTEMDFSNLLPFMDIPVKDFIKASHQVASFPFGETIVFLMIAVFLNKREKTKSSILKAVLFTCPILIIIAIRNTAVLGPFAEFTLFTSFSALRLIDLANIISRIEILVAFNFLTIGFIYVSVTYYGVVLGTAQLFKMRSYKPLVLPIGVFYFINSLTIFDNIIETINYTFNIYPYFSLLFEFFLPLLTLIVAAIKKSPPELKGEQK